MSLISNNIFIPYFSPIPHFLSELSIIKILVYCNLIWSTKNGNSRTSRENVSYCDKMGTRKRGWIVELGLWRKKNFIGGKIIGDCNCNPQISLRRIVGDDIMSIDIISGRMDMLPQGIICEAYDIIL